MINSREKSGLNAVQPNWEGARLKRLKPEHRWNDMDFGKLAVLHWFALRVAAGTEFVVQALLEKRGFVAVVPMRRELRAVSRHVNRKRVIEYPLAPRYVFVGFSERAQWDRVFDITMINGVVGLDGGDPLRMSGVEVALWIIRNMFKVVPDEWKRARTVRDIKKGDWVDVIDGAYAGETVRVRTIKGKVASVLLPLFGRIDMPLAILAKSD